MNHRPKMTTHHNNIDRVPQVLSEIMKKVRSEVTKKVVRTESYEGGHQKWKLQRKLLEERMSESPSLKPTKERSGYYHEVQLLTLI